jgi:hypothetical protein
MGIRPPIVYHTHVNESFEASQGMNAMRMLYMFE